MTESPTTIVPTTEDTITTKTTKTDLLVNWCTTAAIPFFTASHMPTSASLMRQIAAYMQQQEARIKQLEGRL